MSRESHSIAEGKTMDKNQKTLWMQIVHIAVVVNTVVVLPWTVWVTVNIFSLKAKDAEFSTWQAGRETVLKLERSETIQRMTEVTEKRFGEIQGKLDALGKQSVENGYDIRRLTEMMQEAKAGKRTSLYVPSTNIYHIPGSSDQKGDVIDYATLGY